MNTKIILLALTLLLTTPTSSVVSKAIRNAKAFQYELQVTPPTDVTIQIDPLTYPSIPTVPADDHAHKAPKQPEDGKHHHFHFARVMASRRRNVFIVISKIVIAIMHICLFIYCFMHAFH